MTCFSAFHVSFTIDIWRPDSFWRPESKVNALISSQAAELQESFGKCCFPVTKRRLGKLFMVAAFKNIRDLDMGVSEDLGYPKKNWFTHGVLSGNAGFEDHVYN
jgi:hypothetical protein